MNLIESIIYSFTFLTNKYVGFRITEYILNWYENRMINKYVSKKEIQPINIPTIQANELTNDNFIKLSNLFFF